METCFEYTGDTMFMSSDERKYINRIRSLQKKYPDVVVIERQPETNDGCICAKLPASWLRIKPPVTCSEETRAKRREQGIRMAAKNAEAKQ